MQSTRTAFVLREKRNPLRGRTSLLYPPKAGPPARVPPKSSCPERHPPRNTPSLSELDNRSSDECSRRVSSARRIASQRSDPRRSTPRRRRSERKGGGLLPRRRRRRTPTGPLPRRRASLGVARSL